MLRPHCCHLSGYDGTFFSKKKKKKLFEFFDYRSWSEVTGASLPSQMPSLALILLQAHGRYLEHPSRPSPI